MLTMLWHFCEHQSVCTSVANVCANACAQAHTGSDHLLGHRRLSEPPGSALSHHEHPMLQLLQDSLFMTALCQQLAIQNMDQNVAHCTLTSGQLLCNAQLHAIGVDATISGVPVSSGLLQALCAIESLKQHFYANIMTVHGSSVL